MTHAEATALISMLSLAYPRERFSLENSAVYERAIADLEAEDVQRGIESLLQYAQRIPTIAELRGEAAKAKIARVGTRPAAFAYLPPDPSALHNEFSAALTRATEASARYTDMSRAWYAKHGKSYPGDPGLPFVRSLSECVRNPHYTPDILAALERGMGAP